MHRRASPDSVIPRTLDANRIFGRYKREEELRAGKARVREDATCAFRKIWRDFLFSEHDDAWDSYEAACNLAKGHKFSPRDIEGFSIALAAFQHEAGFAAKAGFLLSALIDAGEGGEYVLHTMHLDEAIDNIGYSNSKNIVVRGDAGNSAGSNMLCGNLTIEGDCGDNLGEYMAGGNIALHGNAEDCVGSLMMGGRIRVREGVGNGLGYELDGGEITVCGNVYGGAGTAMRGGTIHVLGDVISIQDDPKHRKSLLPFLRGKDQVIVIGYEMKGGEIHLDGKYRHLADDVGDGRIFHKGKLIRPKSE